MAMPMPVVDGIELKGFKWIWGKILFRNDPCALLHWLNEFATYLSKQEWNDTLEGIMSDLISTLLRPSTLRSYILAPPSEIDVQLDNLVCAYGVDTDSTDLRFRFQTVLPLHLQQRLDTGIAYHAFRLDRSGTLFMKTLSLDIFTRVALLALESEDMRECSEMERWMTCLYHDTYPEDRSEQKAIAKRKLEDVLTATGPDIPSHPLAILRSYLYPLTSAMSTVTLDTVEKP
jgi:hypothetical protein